MVGNDGLFHIRTDQDVAFFLERTNSLHDGYIIGVQYEHRGHSKGNSHWIDPKLSELRIQIMITSIDDAVVELVFHVLSDWQIRDGMSDIIDTSVSVGDNEVIWTDSDTTEPGMCESGSYVVARDMMWRFC